MFAQCSPIFVSTDKSMKGVPRINPLGAFNNEKSKSENTEYLTYIYAY